MRASEIGATRVWMKGDDTAFPLHPDCYEPLLAALTTNSAGFFRGWDCYDSPIFLRLSEIAAICKITPESTLKANLDEIVDDDIDTWDGEEWKKPK